MGELRSPGRARPGKQNKRHAKYAPEPSSKAKGAQVCTGAVHTVMVMGLHGDTAQINKCIAFPNTS